MRHLVIINQLYVVPRFRVAGDWPVGHNNSVDGGKAVLAGLNPQGAVHVKSKNLGLKPDEFDFVCPFLEGETSLIDYGNQTRWTIHPRDPKTSMIDRVILTREFLDDKPELAWFWRVYERAPVKRRPPSPRRDPMHIVCKYGGSY